MLAGDGIGSRSDAITAFAWKKPWCVRNLTFLTRILYDRVYTRGLAAELAEVAHRHSDLLLEFIKEIRVSMRSGTSIQALKSFYVSLTCCPTLWIWRR
jgi:hypothetical protein